MNCTIFQGEYEIHFSFDEGRDDPSEGVTMTGVFDATQRVSPSRISEEDMERAFATATSRMNDALRPTFGLIKMIWGH